MELDGLMQALGMTLQVFMLDLILSGDNALVIAVACRSLPPQLMRKAVMLGTGFAILLRVLLTTVVGFLLQLPLLKLLGAVLLISIAIKLLLGDDDADSLPGNTADSRQLWSAVSVVVMADLALSMDNVVALAAAAQGSVLYLILGLLFSVPLLMYGSLLIARLLNGYPLLLPLGASLLAWVAGQLAVSDPLLLDWVNTQAPALQVVVPLLCVVFVLLESRIIRERAPGLTPPPPLGWLDGLTTRLARMGEATEASAAVPPRPAAAQNAVEQALPASTHRVPLLPPAVSVAAALPSAPATAASDGLQTSPRMALLVKLLLGLAALVGVCALGWLVFHLLSQGFLPTPTPSHKVKH
ncbi:Integral membrane protein [Aquitalea magnusonii]|uniref:Integral membrane protein n=1 Tax=Aquitalea magnusonii TaxID=332411 RepID=A0A3G9GAV2_9NEIS|nr:YjbE family putative metal transport protein [Aquitalea magnusonii]BBF83953.1 Integral membrane protein [Aquitalea magnusonii]